MANINIRRDVTDPFYRYKMERLQSKVEGKGNGIKTVIVNLPNVAHDASKLQDYLDGFIKKFVLCSSCKNPETVVNIKDGDIILDCKACGTHSHADLKHKLSGFILKNAPKKGKKDKSTKKADRKARKEAERNGTAEDGEINGNGHPSPGDSGSDHADENGEVGNEAGSDDELTRKINAEAKELAEPESTKEVQWTVDMSEEAIRARAQALPDDLKHSLAIDGDADGEDTGPSLYDELGKWIDEQAKEKGSIDKVEDVAIYMKAKELGIEAKHRTLAVLAQTLFTDNIVKQLEARSSMLKKMTKGGDKHEKAFLGGIERFVGIDKPELMPKVSVICMQIYTEDIITDEVIKAWASKASKKYVDIKTSKQVRKNAEKFLEYLENASDDEEEEDDE